MFGRAIVAVIAAAIMGMAGTTLSATAANAATPPIGVSTNGVTFASTIPDALFAGVQLVPGGPLMRSVWVKNQTGSAGNVAIAIHDVSSPDPRLLSQLSVSGRTTALIGPSVFFDQVDPCSTILKNIRLEAGRAVRIDLTLLLDSSITGRDAQQEFAAFALTISTASMDVPSPDGCRVTPQGVSRGGWGSGSFGGTITIPGSTFYGDPEVSTPDPVGTATPVPVAEPAESGDGIIVPNTGRFFQEYFVGGWAVAAALGALIAWLIWRRRRRDA